MLWPRPSPLASPLPTRSPPRPVGLRSTRLRWAPGGGRGRDRVAPPSLPPRPHPLALPGQAGLQPRTVGSRPAFVSRARRRLPEPLCAARPRLSMDVTVSQLVELFLQSPLVTWVSASWPSSTPCGGAGDREAPWRVAFPFGSAHLFPLGVFGGGALLKLGVPRWGLRVGTRSDGLGALLSREPET